MEKFEVEGNLVFLGWVGDDVLLREIDDQVQEYQKQNPKGKKLENYMVDLNKCGPDAGHNILYIYSQPIEELKQIIPPDPEKPYRFRIAERINFIMEIYDTLRKLNYSINFNLKEDVVSETIIYFMNRWKKYEYHPRTIPIAIQKYKSLHIDIYRKDKKSVPIDYKKDEEEGYLPRALEHIEGLPLEEVEKNEAVRNVKRAMSQMDEKCREILCYVADYYSEKEIAEMLEIPLGTVASRKSNCIKKMAEILKL